MALTRIQWKESPGFFRGSFGADGWTAMIRRNAPPQSSPFFLTRIVPYLAIQKKQPPKIWSRELVKQNVTVLHRHSSILCFIVAFHICSILRDLLKMLSSFPMAPLLPQIIYVAYFTRRITFFATQTDHKCIHESEKEISTLEFRGHFFGHRAPNFMHC